jgi:putative transposase
MDRDMAHRDDRGEHRQSASLAELDERHRDHALERFAVLRPHLEDGLPLAEAAAQAAVPARTARRWRDRYRRDGLIGLADSQRSDRGVRRTRRELVALIEGLALRRPVPPVAHVHRETTAVARRSGWPAPSYATVYAVVRAMDPGLLALAHDGPARYRERFELVYRRECEAPNAVWQADHTQLDLLVLDATGAPARPWLTVIEDDHSRAIVGYTVGLAAPSALNTALALRQAIWRKTDPAWPMCGIPEVLYSDHGSDFTSRHLEQVCAELHVRLIHSTAGVPQGRGKLERLFGTINTELLSGLPGQLPPGSSRPVIQPALSLAQLDERLGRFIVEVYNQRVHSETKQPPIARWSAGGWLPRMPDSLEQLDLLLLTVARPRKVHRDGIRFEGYRYLDLTLAAYVGERVTIRYDPRDLGEIRVFHHDRFLCRAICPELAEHTLSLKDLQAARNARRRALRAAIQQRRAHADALLTPALDPTPLAGPGPAAEHDDHPTRPRLRLRLYRAQ